MHIDIQRWLGGEGKERIKEHVCCNINNLSTCKLGHGNKACLYQISITRDYLRGPCINRLATMVWLLGFVRWLSRLGAQCKSEKEVDLGSEIMDYGVITCTPS